MAGRGMRKVRRALGWLIAGLLPLLVVLWYLSLPDRPDVFYSAPLPSPSTPGQLLRVEAFGREIPAGARGLRILYTTTRGDGTAALASAIVLAPKSTPSDPMPVIAWTHGTTGVAQGCAPSLLDHPFDNVPAVADVIAKGWTFVATDYVGQGTPGVHGYMLGVDEARAALDAVRAARRIDDVKLASQVVVWGHSQGGHAALWTGSVAAGYAPELSILGVAGLAPASDLPGLVANAQASVIGKLLSSYLVVAYSAAYPDVRVHEVVRPGARLLTRDMARRCLAGQRTLASIGEALLLSGPIFRGDPTQGAFGERLRQNDPREPIAAPVLIAQGAQDDLVLPSLQDAYVARRCASGQRIDYRKYLGRDHLTLVAADSPLVPDLIRWSEDRFRGTAAGNECLSPPSAATP